MRRPARPGDARPRGAPEITTEGGLPVVGDERRVADAVRRLQEAGIVVSLFVDPEAAHVEAYAATGAEAVEFHTGEYANAAAGAERDRQLAHVSESARLAQEAGLVVHAGHGLNYVNVGPIADIPGMTELNIGHSIVSRAVFVGLRKAVREMVRLIDRQAG